MIKIYSEEKQQRYVSNIEMIHGSVEIEKRQLPITYLLPTFNHKYDEISECY